MTCDASPGPVTPMVTEEDRTADLQLRPRWLQEYIGQTDLKERLEISLSLPSNGPKHSTMCCCMGDQDWGRPRLRTSSRLSSA